MLKLSEAEVLRRIEADQPFECTVEDGSFTLKVDEYSPAICTSLHAGHRFREHLEDYCTLDAEERRHEESPHTDQLIQVMPITLVSHDSRFAYDLSRPLATCIHNEHSGRAVWHKALPQRERRQSVLRYQSFYRVLDALIRAVEQRFKACIVFDVRSHNHQQLATGSPLFTLGTEQIDQYRWSAVVQRLQRNLNAIALDRLSTPSTCKEVNAGRGHLAGHINSHFENTLVLPLSVKKVFMDEQTGATYPLVLDTLKEGLKHALVDTTAFFSRRHSRKARLRRPDVLSSRFEPLLLQLDRALYGMARSLETLWYINPVNIHSERKRFFSRHGNYRPKFHYRPLDIDPYRFREQLYRLPVHSIRDPSIEQLYRQVIDSLSCKIDLLVSAGQPRFVYESLKYYGEPNLDDERNAFFLLHAPAFEEEEEKSVSAVALVQRLQSQAAAWGMRCRVELSTRLAAAAMVSNSRKTVYINKGVQLSETEAQALLHHELGVHMATTLNAQAQPLKLFSLGLPGNTMTQEGLAILNEFDSGNLPLRRLKELALRVLAVREMLKRGDFRHTYSYLREEHRMAEDDAFRLAVRVHRGGGLTKDYLYLQGVNRTLATRRQRDIRGLYIGKTGINYLDVIDEMTARELIKPAAFVPEHLAKPVQGGPILEYLVNAIRPRGEHTAGGGIPQGVNATADSKTRQAGSA